MLCKRIIPTMLVRGRTLVKGERFAGDRSVGHVMQAARIHSARGVDELCILDIGATAEGRGPDLDMVRELSEGCFIPITVGGGVKRLQDIDALLRAGADKVCIGRALYTEPGAFITQCAERFGAQAIVCSLDVSPHMGCPQEYAQRLEMLGAGEILLQSIARDGLMCGYDLDLIRAVSAAVSIPVIASGGCSGPEDMLAAIKAGADACAAGALFQFTDVTPKDCAKYLKAHGVEARLATA
jgi:cyclase